MPIQRRHIERVVHQTRNVSAADKLRAHLLHRQPSRLFGRQSIGQSQDLGDIARVHQLIVQSVNQPGRLGNYVVPRIAIG